MFDKKNLVSTYLKFHKTNSFLYRVRRNNSIWDSWQICDSRYSISGNHSTWKYVSTFTSMKPLGIWTAIFIWGGWVHDCRFSSLIICEKKSFIRFTNSRNYDQSCETPQQLTNLQESSEAHGHHYRQPPPLHYSMLRALVFRVQIVES